MPRIKVFCRRKRSPSEAYPAPSRPITSCEISSCSTSPSGVGGVVVAQVVVNLEDEQAQLREYPPVKLRGGLDSLRLGGLELVYVGVCYEEGVGVPEGQEEAA